MIETNKKTKKPHRERKNPGERDRQAKRRQATNAARGKQVWDETLKVWVRPGVDKRTIEFVPAPTPSGQRLRLIDSPTVVS